jgi:glycosyltransferase involved in cell wall biosynthesis
MATDRIKAIVIQRGARHRYAVPRLLNNAGHLEALYTDSNGSFGAGRLIAALPKAWLPRSADRLGQREISGIPPSLVQTTDLLLPLEMLLRRTSSTEYEFNLKRDRLFSSVLGHWGFKEATWIYSMFGEGWSFIESAKQRGIRIALDMFINPITHSIVENERRQFPDWEAPSDNDFSELESDVCRRIELADLLLCPSESVVDGLMTYPAFAAKKIRVVPYGFAVDAHPRGTSPAPRRILFGGAASLRKGIHYLAQAASLLSKSAPHYEFRIAGPVTDSIRSKPECKYLSFLGPLSRTEFLAELELADLLVLPTLAEGSATVIYEALSFGIPVVTTRSAGSVITHGKEGLIIPERDANALADAIRSISEQRDTRLSMSLQATNTAREFSEPLWGQRLIAALQSVA